MNDDKVFQLLMETNPVPDPDGLDSPLALAQLEQRSPTMATDTQSTTERTRIKEVRDKNRRSRLLVAATTAALALIVGLGTWAILGGGGGGEAANPRAAVEGYYEASNSHDLNAIMEFFSEESKIVGHPADSPTRGTPLRGLATIRSVLEVQLGFAVPVNPFTISNVEVSGDTVTWDSRFSNKNGNRFCAEGHSAIVGGGKILFWTHAALQSCPS